MNIKITCGMYWHETRVFIDGVDISRAVHGLQFGVSGDDYDKPTAVTLTLVPDSIELEGEAQVVAQVLNMPEIISEELHRRKQESVNDILKRIEASTRSAILQTVYE